MQIGDVSEVNFKSSETDAALQDETVKLSNMKSRLYLNLLIIGLFQLTGKNLIIFLKNYRRYFLYTAKIISWHVAMLMKNRYSK